jgi:hypothetical protein
MIDTRTLPTIVQAVVDDLARELGDGARITASRADDLDPYDGEHWSILAFHPDVGTVVETAVVPVHIERDAD